MELPKFKYSPNAYELDLFDKIDGICSICEEKRSLKYNSSFYSVNKPDYICPWCIVNGKAAEKYDGEFNSYCAIEGVSPDPNDPKPTIPIEQLTEICSKTPSYSSWQQEIWLSHCNEPSAFIGYATSEMITPVLNEVKEDIEKLELPLELFTEGFTRESSDLGAYLFQCQKCKKHRLHIDFT
ncbi:CbrC family protein [Olleya sp. Bg11-27]|uniref:CbrC family protein n=1 Tax=Olleya sp. Bg11-27 TaxID=2058135 RepID=UPI000C315A3D|nr:CbrC family protein [Olleya sp. Bg11-27]AUC74948.1 hypothetical protein CW732_04365 [Olleya sp. Bg11-27]